MAFNMHMKSKISVMLSYSLSLSLSLPLLFGPWKTHMLLEQQQAPVILPWLFGPMAPQATIIISFRFTLTLVVAGRRVLLLLFLLLLQPSHWYSETHTHHPFYTLCIMSRNFAWDECVCYTCCLWKALIGVGTTRCGPNQGFVRQKGKAANGRGRFVGKSKGFHWVEKQRVNVSCLKSLHRSSFP